jgi:hypothetical protein
MCADEDAVDRDKSTNGRLDRRELTPKRFLECYLQWKVLQFVNTHAPKLLPLIDLKRPVDFILEQVRYKKHQQSRNSCPATRSVVVGD